MNDLTFRCFLKDDGVDDLPSDLGFVEGLWIQKDKEPPNSVAARIPHRSSFYRCPPILWVEDSLTGVISPFWVPRRFESELGRVVERDSANDLDPTFARCLYWAGALERVSDPSRSGKRRRAILDAHQAFCAFRFANISDLLHPGQIARVRAYYNELVAECPQKFAIDGNGRYSQYNEPLMRFLHYQLTPLVSQIVGCGVLPSYAHFVGYGAGGRLRTHTDRPQCEVTISLLIDFKSTQPEAAWPIYLKSDNRVYAVNQKFGDMLFFRGRELPHWRETLAAGCRSHSLLFHYVAETFCESLH